MPLTASQSRQIAPVRKTEGAEERRHLRTDQDDVELFLPLTEFKAPSMPTEEMFRRYLGRLQALITRKTSKPLIANDQLKKATIDRLDEVVAPPACGPLLAELERTIAAWRGEPKPVSHIKMVVLPPCDENAILETWARDAGHQLLDPPDRSALLTSSAPVLPRLDGEGLLVVPRLEHWFLRHRNGLRTVRELLATLDVLRRPVVIGCNSWAWAYLGKAVGVDQLMPDAVTFRAFDQMRLHRWLAQLVDAESTGAVRFRLPRTGEDVLAEDDEGKPRSDYLQTLAGRSLGIPWVAWHMWRRSLRSGEPQTAADGKAAVASMVDAGEQTLWIAALDEYVLPGAHEKTALLLLQALLIHGPLTPQEMRLVLPIVGESNIAPVLAKAGFLDRRGDYFACRAATYPAIREGLASAGFPLDGF